MHLRVGAAALFGFAALGVLLESLHAWKASWYLGVAGETRRFLFTLAHAHGVGLGLVNLALAAVLPSLPGALPPLGVALPRRRHAAGAGRLLRRRPLRARRRPGLGALLVPPGALLVVVALALVLRAALARDRG